MQSFINETVYAINPATGKLAEYTLKEIINDNLFIVEEIKETNGLKARIAVEAIYLDDLMNDKLEPSNDNNKLLEEIKENRLCLNSILQVSEQKLRESLLKTFAEFFVSKGPSISKIPHDFKQFDKIAELIEDEMNRFGYPKDLARFDVINLISSEIESVGIQINSDEGLEFIDFLKARWKC